MERHRRAFRIVLMVRILGVSRSGYSAWRNRVDVSERQHAREKRDALVARAFAARKSRYGSPRLVLDLCDARHSCNRKTVASSLRRQGLRAKAAKRFEVTTNSKHDLPVAANLLEQNFNAKAPNEKWVGDITYLWTDEGWLYLATVLDLYSRRVIGWSMSERMTASLVCNALTMALWRRQFPRGVIMHTDRGSQYCSNDYQRLLNKHGLVCSMGGKGNCYDNACAESFFHTLKVELIHGERFATRGHMRQAVFQYIETDCNKTRRHGALGYISPEAFEASRVA